MGRITKKKSKYRNSHTANANYNETKEKIYTQGYRNITQICLISRFLNNSFSPIVANKIKEYRLNDALLANKPYYLVVKDYIKMIEEHHSKAAYLAGSRGNIFFAFLYKVMEQANPKNNTMKFGGTIVRKTGGL